MHAWVIGLYVILETDEMPPEKHGVAPNSVAATDPIPHKGRLYLYLLPSYFLCSEVELHFFLSVIKLYIDTFSIVEETVY